MTLPSTSRHFHLEPLTDGVYAAISREGGAARSNAGIIDLGDRTLIFDTFMTPAAARDLVAAAEQVTGRAPALAVNSHRHLDHVLGNQALPADTAIISTHRTHAAMIEQVPASIAGLRELIPRSLGELGDQPPAPEDADHIAVFRAMEPELPRLSLRAPTITFEQRLVLHSPARTVEIITFGGGHTESDAILYLPGDQIAFVADLLFNEIHPWMGDGDPDENLRINEKIEALTPAVDVVVPGHGAVCTPAAFAPLRRYVAALHEVITKAKTSGGTAEDAAAVPVPAAFSAWPNPERFGNNVKALFDRFGASA